MKTFKLIFALVITSTLVIFQSCSSSDDSQPENTSLIGDWKVTEFSAETSTTTNFDGEIFESNINILGSNFDYNVNFTAANYTTLGAYDMTVTILVDGQPNETETESYENVSGSGTYTIDGNVMTITGSFFDVDGLDVIGGDYQTATFQFSPDGQTVTFTQNEQMTQGTGGVSTDVTITSTTVMVRL